MGAGKSTLGKRLANKLGFDFYDTDNLFEERYKISIQQFFGKYDEQLFRKLEHECFEDTLGYTNCVVSTGGGLPCYFNAMEKINQSGLSIYLELNEKAIFQRLINSKQKRPLLSGLGDVELMQYITDKLNERSGVYKKAKITFPGIGYDIDEITTIIQQLK